MRTDGFTLVEVLVAVVLFGLVVGLSNRFFVFMNRSEQIKQTSEIIHSYQQMQAVIKNEETIRSESELYRGFGSDCLADTLDGIIQYKLTLGTDGGRSWQEIKTWRVYD